MFALLVTAALAGGCMVHGHAGVAYTSDGYASGNGDLVYVSPGVYAVADYDQPVFYSDDAYWLYRDGDWYRSGYYTGGWVHVRTPPSAVLSINRPTAYVHYHGAGRPRIQARDHRVNAFPRDHGNVRYHQPHH
ncbi:MAG TPA: hypothetical protein VHE35_31580 [Kofleriaceae bacterium]|nr:hypothetical protein [Kofleriaceae bacterium]